MAHAGAVDTIDAAAERRRQRLQALGIALIAVGVGMRVVQQRLVRVRVAADAMQRRAGIWLDDPGSVAALFGTACIEAGRRPTPKR